MTLSLTWPAYGKDLCAGENVPEAGCLEGPETGTARVSQTELISSIDLELAKDGHHTAGIYSEILCHTEMEAFYMTVCLQRSEGTDFWKTVNTQDFSWKKEDFPEEDLSMVLVSYKVGALPDGEYRLRGLYSVYEKEGERQESRTVTSPVLRIE